MTKIVTVLNEKGGIGKTTTVNNLGAILAMHGKRVLVVDVDPQASLTTAHGEIPAERDIFTGAIEPRVTRVAGMELLPSSGRRMKDLEARFQLNQQFGQLKLVLENYAAAYDLVLIDCPANINALTSNAIVAGTEFLMPCYMGNGLLQIDSTLTAAREVEIAGFPVTRQVRAFTTMMTRTSLDRTTDAHFRSKYPFWMETQIRNSTYYRRSEVNGKWKPAVAVCSKNSPPNVDYKSLAQELGLLPCGPKGTLVS